MSSKILKLKRKEKPTLILKKKKREDAGPHKRYRIA